jgi:hypothetical protein
MQAVSLTYHLISRRGVCPTGVASPHLVQTLGKKTIQLSLEIFSLKEGKKRRAAEDLA